MSLLWIVLAVTVPASQSSADDAPRPLREFNRQVNDLCSRDTLAKTEQERAAIAYEMVLVYREILADPRYATSENLKRYRGRLWSRLTRIKKDAQAKIRREAKSQNKLDMSDDEFLSQVSGTSQALSDQFALVGTTLGGPAGIFGQAAAGGGVGPPDFGPDLVDLIQRTIQPQFWNVNGGPGSIVYYRPLHCLVIRATSHVHHQVGGVLGALR